MRIVHVVEPFAAGVAVFIKSLTETMPDDLHIIIHGERRVVMSAKEVKSTFPKQNVRFIRWKSVQRSINPFKDLMALAELHKIMKRLRRNNLVDAVHLHSSKSGFLGRLACKLAGISNVIYTPNGAPFLANKNFLSKFLYRKLEKLGNNFGGKVVCCSASELTEYHKIGVGGAYINNGTTLPKQTPNPKRKTAADPFIIITTGRIEEQKNPALFNAIAAYFEDFSQVKFVWAGDGSSRHALTATNIEITGWLPQQDVTKRVAEADIFLSTSAYEGLSFSVLEALALRKPVLLSNCVGNADIIKNGLNGDIFKGKPDAILKLMTYLNNREMVEVMGRYAQNVCTTEFDMHQNYSGYKSLYRGFKPASVRPAFAF